MIIPQTIPEIAMFKTKEVAALFSVRQGKVHEWITYGKINAVKIAGVCIRIPYNDLMQFKANSGKGFVNNGKKAVTNRMISGMRSRMNSILKGKIKAKGTMKLVGCSPEELRTHIEKQFLPGMTWGNYGREGWTIDHIIPCAQFDLSIPDSQKICFNYMNLQPLWHIDNIKKGKKYTRRNIRKVITRFHSIS